MNFAKISTLVALTTAQGQTFTAKKIVAFNKYQAFSFYEGFIFGVVGTQVQGLGDCAADSVTEFTDAEDAVKQLVHGNLKGASDELVKMATLAPKVIEKCPLVF